MVEVIVAKHKIDCEHLLGQYVGEDHYDTLIETDTDCFIQLGLDDSYRSIGFKFRKNWFSQEEQDQAYAGLREAATESQNRGLAAGPRGDSLATEGRQGRDWVTDYELEILDFLLEDGMKLVDDQSIQSIRAKYAASTPKSDETRGRVWMRSEVTKIYPEYHGWFDKWLDGLSNKPIEEQRKEANKIASKWISVTNYAKSVFSGVAGWYDRYPRIPFGRATSYTRDQPEKFAMAYPFLQSLDRGYRELAPELWANQKAAADKLDSRYLVPETVFTTITVNKSFRTASHRDAGDFDKGLSNLLVVGTGDFTGGYLVLPEYRIAINVRPGDMLLINNHEVIHGNTPIVLENDKAERISLVCYFREKMLELGSFEYETAREQYVEDRRNDKSHKFQRNLWNGVSPGMWDEKEWYDYLEAKLGSEAVKKYHPNSNKASLESFF